MWCEYENYTCDMELRVFSFFCLFIYSIKELIA